MSGKSNIIVSKKSVKPIGQLKNGRSVKVLVVDDIFVDRKIISQILKSTGFDVIGEAEDGVAGLINIEGELPHIVILDYIMPEMDGMSVLKEIRQKYPTIYVIMGTSQSESDIVIELINAGAKDYIVKPFDRTLIIEKLKLAVERIEEKSKGKSYS